MLRAIAGLSAMWLLVLCLAIPARAQQAPRSLILQADSSLMLPISELARLYTLKTHQPVALFFVQSQHQIHDIVDGAVIDLLITARRTWIDALSQQGLVDPAFKNVIAKNQLVLVAPPTSTEAVDLAHGFNPAPLMLKIGPDNFNFVIGHPESLAEGGASREALRNLGVDGDLEPYMEYPRTLEKLRKAVLKKNAYGLMYASDAKETLGIRILGALPDSSYTPIHYTTLVLAGDNMENARAFVKYLQQKEAGAVFSKYGLGAAPAGR